MAISRGQYGMGGRITAEYFAVEAKLPDGGCYSDMVSAPTRGVAYTQAARKFTGCKITLHVVAKERYLEEMEQAAYWAKHAGGARGPEPIL